MYTVSYVLYIHTTKSVHLMSSVLSESINFIWNGAPTGTVSVRIYCLLYFMQECASLTWKFDKITETTLSCTGSDLNGNTVLSIWL